MYGMESFTEEPMQHLLGVKCRAITRLYKYLGMGWRKLDWTCTANVPILSMTQQNCTSITQIRTWRTHTLFVHSLLFIVRQVRHVVMANYNRAPVP